MLTQPLYLWHRGSHGSRNNMSGTSLVIQWVRLHDSTAWGTGLTLGWRTKVPHPTQWGQKKKKKNNISILVITADRLKVYTPWFLEYCFTPHCTPRVKATCAACSKEVTFSPAEFGSVLLKCFGI